MSALLDALIFGYRKIFANGVEQNRRDGVDFIGSNITITDNPTTKRTEVEVSSGQLIDVGAITATIFVDGSYAGGGSDGTIGKPWTTIQDAIDAVPVVATADTAPTQIVVAPGTYSENPQVIANQQVILGPWLQDARMLNALTPATPTVTVDGHFVWIVSAGAAGISVLHICGFQFDGMLINSTAPASTPRMALVGCSSTDSISSSGYTGKVTCEKTTITGDLDLPNAAATSCEDVQVSGDCNAFLLYSRNLTVGGSLTTQSLFADNTNVGSVLSVTNNPAVARGTTFADLSLASGALVIFDDVTMRVAAKFGALPETDTVGNNNWRGGAGYYALQHTVRVVSSNETANLADETILADTDGGAVAITLPPAELFADATETRSNTRRPARHLRIKNIGDDALGIVPDGGDAYGIDGDTNTLPVRSGCGVELVAVESGGNWGWETLNGAGTFPESDATSSGSDSSSGTPVDILTISVPPKPGRYKVTWFATTSVNNADTYAEIQIYNDTDTTQIAHSILGGDTGEDSPHAGVAFVDISGSAKMIKLQLFRAAGTGTAHLIQAAIAVEWLHGPL